MKTTNERFDEVLKSGLKAEMSEERLNYKAQIVKSSEYPELSVIDYVLWAVQRFIRNGEDRFIKALKDKIVLISEEDKAIAIYSVTDFLRRHKPV